MLINRVQFFLRILDMSGRVGTAHNDVKFCYSHQQVNDLGNDHQEDHKFHTKCHETYDENDQKRQTGDDLRCCKCYNGRILRLFFIQSKDTFV